MYIVSASFLALFSFIPYGWLYGPADPGGFDVRFIDGATEIRTVAPGGQAEREGPASR